MLSQQNSVKKEPGWLRPVVDYGPLVAFLVAYWLEDIMAATLAIMVATVVAVILSLVIARRVPMMPLVTAAVVMMFGGLTLFFNDETFIKMKPTIVQVAFAMILGIGLLLKRLWLKVLMAKAVTMPDAAWRTLTIRFIVFFLAGAVLNELVWRTQSTDFWVNFKVFGLMGLTFLFILSQTPFLHKHAVPEDKKHG